jgi:hypothetical protein
MSIERDGKFITLSAGGEALKLPFAAYESGKQIIATVVDQARTADGIVRGSVVAKASKIELKWAVLTPNSWKDICRFFDKHFYFNATYLDMTTNTFKTKKFYVGDRSAQPFMIDSTTGIPKYYLNCEANIIGVGEKL